MEENKKLYVLLIILLAMPISLLRLMNEYTNAKMVIAGITSFISLYKFSAH